MRTERSAETSRVTGTCPSRALRICSERDESFCRIHSTGPERAAASEEKRSTPQPHRPEGEAPPPIERTGSIRVPRKSDQYGVSRPKRPQQRSWNHELASVFLCNDSSQWASESHREVPRYDCKCTGLSSRRPQTKSAKWLERPGIRKELPSQESERQDNLYLTFSAVTRRLPQFLGRKCDSPSSSRP